MVEKILFADDEPALQAVLDEYDDVTVIERYKLGTRYAAKIDTTSGGQISALDADDRVGVEDSFEGHLLTAPETYANEGGAVTINQIREFHSIFDDSETGKNVTVAITDSGIDAAHPLFSDADVRQIDCTDLGHGDRVGHGTGVAGQIHSIAPDASLIMLRIFGEEGTTSDEVILRAYQWLLDHTDEYDIVNMSWGASEPVRQLDQTHTDLLRMGVRDVVAAGNSGSEGGSPATARQAFSVGACTIEGDLASFSSYDPDRGNPDVCAIGKNCKLARGRGTTMGEPIDDEWTKASGTSFSAPETAGMVARYYEYTPGVEINELADAFRRSARDIPDTPEDGAGIVDYRDALGS